MSTQDAADVTINKLTLDGKTMHVDVSSSMVSAILKRSMDEAPTLTLGFHDPYQKLVRAGLFAERLTAQLDGRSFELVQLTKNGPNLNVTMEVLAVAEMRRRTTPVGVEANTMTRFDFAKKLLDEIGWIPIQMSPGVTLETTKVQMARGVVASTPADSGQIVTNLFNKDTGQIETSKSTTLTAVQVARVAAQAGFKGEALVIIVAIAKGESKFKADAENPTQHYGLWQIASTHTALLAKYKNNWKDPLNNAKMAYELSGSGKNNFRPWEVYTDSSSPVYYKKYMDEARAAVSNISSLQADTGEGTTVPVGQLTASQRDKLAAQALLGGAEDTWTCIKRIFADINFRCYVDFNSQNQAIIVVGPDNGFTSVPPEIIITEDSPGVDTIDYDFDIGKATATGTIFCRSHRWQLPPGTQIILPTTGLPNPWIVRDISRSLFEIACTVSISKPEPALPEPEAPTKADGIASGLFTEAVDGLGDVTDLPLDTALTTGNDKEWQYPFTGNANVTTRFGSTAGRKSPHQGTDFALPQGTAIYASQEGTVNHADGKWDPTGYGNLVSIIRQTGHGQFETFYGHLSKIVATKGLAVKAGQLIGLSGGQPGAPGSGRSSGPHLHFEVRLNGRAMDPEPLLKAVTPNIIVFRDGLGD